MTKSIGVARRLFGFAALPLLSSLSPFVVLPVIARSAGVESWATIGLGQSIGAFAAIVVIGGWSLYGPVRVAAASREQRAMYYGQSLTARCILFTITVPAATAVGTLLIPSGQLLLGVLTIAAFAATGLSPAWYAIGAGRPGLIARYEVVPRVLASLGAALIVNWTGFVWVYPLMLLMATMLGLVTLHRRVGPETRIALLPALRLLWADRSGALAVIASGLYSAIPVAVVGAFVTVGELARFSSGDRMYRIGLMAVVALSNAVVGWVAEQSGGWGRRSNRSLAALSILGLVGGTGIWLLSVPVSTVLFGAELATSPATSFWYGIAFAGVCVNTSLGGHHLIPMNRARAVLLSTLVGAVVGLGAMVALTPLAGAAGGAAGLALGEVVVCAIQAHAVVRAVRLLKAGAVATPQSAPVPTEAKVSERADAASTLR